MKLSKAKTIFFTGVKRLIKALNTTSLELATEVAAAMRQALPPLTLERCLWINNLTSLLVAGLWPLAHPAPVVVVSWQNLRLAPCDPTFVEISRQATRA